VHCLEPTLKALCLEVDNALSECLMSFRLKDKATKQW
jgi:hypothetical protein